MFTQHKPNFIPNFSAHSKPKSQSETDSTTQYTNRYKITISPTNVKKSIVSTVFNYLRALTVTTTHTENSTLNISMEYKNYHSYYKQLT